MRLADKIATMAGRGAPLPYLRRVAYLESNGGQYIDTGLLADADYDVELKVRVKDTGFGVKAIFGCYVNSGGKLYNVIYNHQSGGKRFEGGVDSVPYANFAISDTEIDYVIKISRSGSSVNGEMWNGSLAGDVNYSGLTLLLFARNTTSGPSILFVGSIYYLKIAKNGEDVISLIPVIDLSGRPAKYDEVSGNLFYNQGTGEFGWKELDGTIVPPQ